MTDIRVRTSVVVVHNGQLLAFNAEDPTSGRPFVFLPGGGIEADETAPEAAERESWEETGFQVSVDPLRCVDKEYVFHWDGEDHACLTIFYRGVLRSPIQHPVRDVPFNKGVVWVPLAEVKERFSYSDAILDAILELLDEEERG